MLEEVREAGMARPLVLRPDVVPEVHGDNRARVVFVDEDVESVGQRVLGEGNIHRNLPQVGISLP